MNTSFVQICLLFSPLFRDAVRVHPYYVHVQQAGLFRIHGVSRDCLCLSVGS